MARYAGLARSGVPDLVSCAYGVEAWSDSYQALYTGEVRYSGKVRCLGMLGWPGSRNWAGTGTGE